MTRRTSGLQRVALWGWALGALMGTSPTWAVGYAAGCQWTASLRSNQPALVLTQDSTPLPVSLTLTTRPWIDGHPAAGHCHFDQSALEVNLVAEPGAVPMGSVKVTVNPTPVQGGTVALGTGSLQTDKLPPGSYTVRPQFSLDGFPVTFGLMVVTPQVPRVTASVSPHPRVGKPITLGVNVNGVQPGGQVEWVDRKSGVTLASATVKNNVASATLTLDKAQQLTITARYKGDKFNLPGESAGVPLDFAAFPLALPSIAQLP